MRGNEKDQAHLFVVCGTLMGTLPPDSPLNPVTQQSDFKVSLEGNTFKL